MKAREAISNLIPILRFVFLVTLFLSDSKAASTKLSGIYPRCCGYGKRLDRDFRCADSAGNDSEEKNVVTFFPKCASGDEPLEVTLKPAGAKVRVTRVTESLGYFTLRRREGEIQTFFDVHQFEEEEEDARNAITSDETEATPDQKQWPSERPATGTDEADHIKGTNKVSSIPATFCLDRIPDEGTGPHPSNDGIRALVCPKKRFDANKIEKCCPFGEELEFPLPATANATYNCLPSEPHQEKSKRWRLLLNGYGFPLQDLIRFPYDYVAYKYRPPDQCPFDPKSGKGLVFDHSAFVVDKDARLTFTRVEGHAPETAKQRPFCIDLATVDPEGQEVEGQAAKVKKKLYLMMAVFCPQGKVNSNLLTVRLPSNSSPDSLVGPARTLAAFIPSLILWCFYFHLL